MSHFKVNEKDIFFILKEQLHYGRLETILNEGREVLDMPDEAF